MLSIGELAGDHGGEDVVEDPVPGQPIGQRRDPGDHRHDPHTTRCNGPPRLLKCEHTVVPGLFERVGAGDARWCLDEALLSAGQEMP